MTGRYARTGHDREIRKYYKPVPITFLTVFEESSCLMISFDIGIIKNGFRMGFSIHKKAVV